MKIADFGLSKMVVPEEMMKMPCGTLTYVAPEVLSMRGYGREADLWSVGCIMHLLCVPRNRPNPCPRTQEPPCVWGRASGSAAR